MKKLTAGIFAGILTIVGVGAANAEIASKGYVDQEAGKINTTIGTVTEGETVVSMIEKAQSAATYDDTEIKAEIADVKTTADAALPSATYNTDTTVTDGTYIKAANKVGANLSALDTGAKAAKDAADAAQADVTALEGTVGTLTTTVGTKANQSDLTALTTRVGTAETDIGSLETKVGTAELTTTAQNIAEAVNELKSRTDNMATDETVTSLTNRVTAAEGKITTAEGDITALETNKQDKLTEAQLNAVNSGVTAAKVTTYDAYDARITTAQAQADKGVADAATADGKAVAAQNTANEAKATADAAIPKPTPDCTDLGAKCVLTVGTAGYAWEIVERGTAE